MSTRILIVDDEEVVVRSCLRILGDGDYVLEGVASGAEALRKIETVGYDVLILDIMMPRMDGMEVLQRVKEAHPDIDVIMITGLAEIDTAVKAMKLGAFDYLPKPFDPDELKTVVGRALERRRLMTEGAELVSQTSSRYRLDSIVGSSEAMQGVYRLVVQCAPTNSTVLITGESGTGKELIARAIHFNSLRKEMPFIAVDCNSLTETLLESELFGYEAGAFTGAASRRTGLFEATTGGTLFLDEVGDLPQITQSKILRVLQEKEVRRLGGRDAIKVDVRIITATNKDIEKEMQKGGFREDLYYRLKVVTIELPPLRERKEDIPALTDFFIRKYNQEFGKRIKGSENSAMKALEEYHWPGNIRQLESVIEKAVLMCDSNVITLKDIKSELKLFHPYGILSIDVPDEGINFEELENELLKKAMAKANNVAAKAARLLGMSYKTFWYRWEKLESNTSPKKDKIS